MEDFELEEITRNVIREKSSWREALICTYLKSNYVRIDQICIVEQYREGKLYFWIETRESVKSAL